jgi:hypothetical protein
MTSLHDASDERPQCGRRRIVRLAEIVVQLIVRGLAGADHGDRNAGRPEHRREASRLGRGVGMLGHVEQQKGRNVFPLRHMRDGGEVTMPGQFVSGRAKDTRSRGPTILAFAYLLS